MGKQATVTLANLTSVAANTAVDVGALESKAMYVGGTFVATYDVEESADGTVFIKTHTGKTAAGVWDLKAGTLKARVAVTAFTSGTVQSAVTGRDPNRL